MSTSTLTPPPVDLEAIELHPPGTSPLGHREVELLRTCEAQIEKGLDSFFSVGQALAVIRDSRLYREAHTSWEAYLEERWQMSDRRARQYITASQFADEIGTMVPVLPDPESRTGPLSVLPKNERQVRPLASLPPDEQREAWRESVESAPRGPDGQPRVTGQHVKETVERRQRVATDAARDSESLKPPPTFDDDQPVKLPATKPPETVLDAATSVAAALNDANLDGAREAATAALGVLDKRWRGTSAENLTRSIERLQKALARDGRQKQLALCVELLLRAIARGDA